MKKILYAALAALMLISCDPNAPKIPNKDKKMLDAAGKGVMNLLGEKKKTAISAVEDLGFVELENFLNTPKRLHMPENKEASAVLSYAYGDVKGFQAALDEANDDESEEPIEDWIEQFKKKKQIFVVLNIYLDDANRVQGLVANFLAGKDIKNINALYLSFSQSIFASLGEDDIEWIGNLCESEDLEDEESAPEYYELKKRDDFEEDYQTYEFPYASEFGTCPYEKDDHYYRSYQNTWGDGEYVEGEEMEGLITGTMSVSLRQKI